MKLVLQVKIDADQSEVWCVMVRDGGETKRGHNLEDRIGKEPK